MQTPQPISSTTKKRRTAKSRTSQSEILSNLTVDANLDPATGRPKQARFVTVHTAEKWLIEQSRINPSWFIYYLTGMEPPLHFRMWYSMLFNFADPKFYRLNFLAPRESGKTTAITYGMAWFISRFPWLTNAIVSVSSTIAQKRLAMIKDIIDIDTRYRNVFPWVYTDDRQRNTVDQFSIYADALYNPADKHITTINYNIWRSLVKRIGSPKDPTINCGGVAGRGLIGSRWSGIFLMDDIIDHTMLTDDIQDTIMQIIVGTYVPALKEKAKGVNIGTRWMPNDVPERLKKNPAWHTVEIPAMMTDPDTGELKSYWPQYWPVQKLLDKKAEMDDDAMFEIMYMNNPQGLIAAKFRQSGLAQALPPQLPAFKFIYVGTDFAVGTKTQHDFNAFTAVGIDAANRIYILDLMQFKATPDVVLQNLIDFATSVLERFGRLDKILIEKVGFQTNIGFDLSQKASQLPVDYVPLAGDKDHRVSMLARKSNNNEVFYPLNHKHYKALVSEALNFSPNRGHDDMLDSITIVLLYSSRSGTSAKVRRVRSRHMI